MLMLQHFNLTADQSAAAIPAALLMTMKNRFPPAANQLRGIRLRRLLFSADQHIDHAVAFIRMLMIAFAPANQFFGELIARFAVLVAAAFHQSAGDLRILHKTIGIVVMAVGLLRAAHQIAVFIPTVVSMPVAVTFLQATNKVFHHGQTAVFMLMAGGLFLIADKRFPVRPAGVCIHMLRTGQFAALPDIAFFTVSMRIYRRIAVGGMTMLSDHRERAQQLAVFIIAGGAMRMHDKIRIPTVQLSLCIFAACGMTVDIQRLRRTDHFSSHGNDLRIAGITMRMHRDLTIGFHCDDRSRQRIGGAEHPLCAQKQHQPLPASVKAAVSYILLYFSTCGRILGFICHHLLFYRSEAGDRPYTEHDLAHDLFLSDASDL